VVEPKTKFKKRKTNETNQTNDDVGVGVDVDVDPSSPLTASSYHQRFEIVMEDESRGRDGDATDELYAVSDDEEEEDDYEGDDLLDQVHILMYTIGSNPGSYVCQGSVPLVLPGLSVSGNDEDIISFPLTETGALKLIDRIKRVSAAEGNESNIWTLGRSLSGTPILPFLMSF